MLKSRFSERQAVLLFCAVYAVLTVVTWGIYLHHPTETTYPLFTVADRFTDLTTYRAKMLHLNSGTVPIGSGLPVFNYLAPAAFVYSWLLNTGHPVRTFIFLVTGSFALLLLGAASVLYRRRLLRPLYGWALVLLSISYPIAFLLARGNLEGIVWILVTAFLVLLLRGQILISSLLLGLAMSIKPFPIVFLLVLLQRRRWLAVIASAGLGLAANLFALHLLGPSITAAYRGLKPGVELYASDYVRGIHPLTELAFGHGILDCLKTLYLLVFASNRLHFLGISGSLPASAYLKTPTALLATAAVITIITFTVMVWQLRRMPPVNQLCGCCIALTLFPPVAADYTLCSLYVPVLLFGYNLAVQARANRLPWTGRHLAYLLLPCAILMAPLRCFRSWMGPVHTLFLYLLLFGVLTIPLSYGAAEEITAKPQEALP